MKIPLASEESEKELYNLLKMAKKGSPVICMCNEPILRECILDDLYSQLQSEGIKIYRIERIAVKKALEKYNRSLKISEEIGDKLGIALTLGQVGSVKYEQKRYQEAISALSRVASIFEEPGSPLKI